MSPGSDFERAEEPRPPHEDGEWFRMLVESVRDYAILGLDVDGRVTSWNRGAEKIKGYTAEEIIGRHYATFYPPEDVEAGIPARQLEVAAVEGRLEASGWRIRKDGSRFWANVAITALYDEQGRLCGFGKVTRDVTERREHLQALERHAAELAEARDEALEARRVAEDATFAKSSFLATMSHEIRTPMNGIVGMIELLLDTPLDSEQREYAQTVQTSAESLLHVIGEILDFSRIEAGHMDVDATEFDIRELADGCVGLLGGSATSKGIDLRVEAPAGPILVYADAGRARQVLVNLVGNAIKFTESGSVTVRITAGADHEPVAVAVIDTGIGIARDALPRLFSAFEQADAATANRYGGSGLGLAISKQLVELMDGTLEATSTPGAGSTFTFTLPPASTATARPKRPVLDGRFKHDLHQRLQAEAPTAGGAAALGDLGVTVLVVDDNPVNQLVAATTLEKAGCRVELAINGEEAVTKHGADAYDVIIMDCQMPVMDGLEATRAIRASEAAGHRTPIIGLTAGALAGDEQRCLAAGMDVYLSKPLNASKLINAIRDLLAGDLGATEPIAGEHDSANPAPASS